MATILVNTVPEPLSPEGGSCSSGCRPPKKRHWPTSAGGSVGCDEDDLQMLRKLNSESTAAARANCRCWGEAALLWEANENRE